MSNIQFGAVELPDAKSVKVTEFPIGRNQRLASGRMVIDIVTYKKKIDITWSYALRSTLQLMITQFNTTGFFTLTYPYNGASTTSTVKMGDLSSTLLFKDPTADNWKYSGITLSFEEQ